MDLTDEMISMIRRGGDETDENKRLKIKLIKG